jgi:general secretion pathway protein K
MVLHTCRNERGIALFFVLWILALLSVIVGEFCHTMRAEVNMTGNFSYRTKAYYTAYAGIQMGIQEVLKSRMSVPANNMTDEKTGKEEIEWRLNTDIPPMQLGEDSFKVRIDNESGKVNINTAGSQLLRMILRPFDLEDHEKDVIVDSILDWRDKDHLHRLNGAENDYYEQLPHPYKCKDGDFDSIEELLLVRGMTESIFYGGLKNMVTVFGSGVPNKKVMTPTKINLNAASPQMLASLPMMTLDMVRDIESFRKEKDFASLGEFASIVGPDVYQAALGYLTLQLGPYYTISSTGFARDGSASEALSAVIKIDNRAPNHYLILKWNDSSEALSPVPENFES